MTQQERSGLNEAAEISAHAAGAVHGAIKTGKAVSGAAKGAAAAGPYGAAAAALWTHRKAVAAIIAGLLVLPVLFIMLLPSLIFGGLTKAGVEGSPDTPILNDNAAIAENINQISQAISDLLEEGQEDVHARIDADFIASGADQKEIINPYESSPAYNANRFIAMYCAAKNQDYASISLGDMENVIRKAKDALYTFTGTEESRTTTVTETNTDPKTDKVTVTETEVTEIWKIYIAVCGTGGVGKTFLILLMALRMRRMVIMAPEMVRVISPDPSVCKTCKVYLLTMQFTTSWDSGCITELYADYDMARFAMLKGIREEQAEGCVKDWAERDALEEECCTDFYEAWHRDKYSEKHFTASIEKLSLTLPQRIIEAE